MKSELQYSIDNVSIQWTKGLNIKDSFQKFRKMSAVENKIEATTVEAQNTLMASLVPVCLTIPLKDPITKNPIKEAIPTMGI